MFSTLLMGGGGHTREKDHQNVKSLIIFAHDCRPPLQNKLWNVLFRGRFYPVCLTGDLRKTFLQVRFRPWAFNLHVRCSAFYQFSPS